MPIFVVFRWQLKQQPQAYAYIKRIYREYLFSYSEVTVKLLRSLS